MPTREERITGGLYGLLIGDALGVPYEFHDPGEIPAPEAIDFQPPAGFDRSHGGVPPGTWSDDGSHALCLLDSLLYNGQLDLEDLGRRLVNWLEWGYLAVDGEVFDVGIQTRKALASLRSGAPALMAGPKSERDNGNGALMRVLPLVLWHRGDDAKLASDAMAQSRVTHGHMRSQVCCAVYCLWARRVLDGAADPWADALATFRVLYPEGFEARTELDTNVARPDAEEPPGTGSGYVVDCLRSARQCVATGRDYEGVVKAAVRLGRDTDTTAAVAGGIAGLMYGVQEIPERWRSALRGQELLKPLLDKLLAHARG
ncbi:ADP-ribosylglycohydrolase family protein [Pyxidicoccus fallax]|uniref:ADP-ribosylglycohydrolase family protein n=1 Tax=Pyxidicoccus fallax TaxID=394095 RepID=A0A848LP27_9BACT|nr:ADP-ribosylglycohydrolase family protein [Pyxidicoccus fallax]NMO19627.1 ADP-ribosylglycohydrolase family protein [Pyxidicoccus fallax]NPC85986.1 ADP-ribosylglycohydrolase family protein [Pyxidicoccus fallax]